MNIKRLFLLATVIAAVSCNKQDDDKNPAGGGNVVGTWACVKTHESSVNVNDPNDKGEYTDTHTANDWELYFFHADSTFFFHQNGGGKPEDTGRYVIMGNKMIINSSYRPPSILDTFMYKVNGNIMETTRGAERIGNYIHTFTYTWQKQ